MAGFRYFVGKQRIQVQTGPHKVEYRNPGDPLPEAADWPALEQYIAMGHVIRAPAEGALADASDNELLKAEVEADGEPDTEPQPDGFPVHLGGGMYELSDGEHVRGKAKAGQAQQNLDKG